MRKFSHRFLSVLRKYVQAILSAAVTRTVSAFLLGLKQIMCLSILCIFALLYVPLQVSSGDVVHWSLKRTDIFCFDLWIGPKNTPNSYKFVKKVFSSKVCNVKSGSCSSTLANGGTSYVKVMGYLHMFCNVPGVPLSIHSKAHYLWNHFAMQVNTQIGRTQGLGSDWKFLLATNNRDLFAILLRSTKIRQTKASRVYIHVLEAATGYKTLGNYYETALSPVDPKIWDFALGTNRDLYCFQRQGHPSKHTAVHILSASSKYKKFRYQTATPISPTDENCVFQVAAGSNDIYVINKKGSSKYTEIFVLPAATGYKKISLHVSTPLSIARNMLHQWEFLIHPYTHDLLCLKHKPTETGQTQIYVASAAKGYKQYKFISATALGQLGPNWEFAGVDSNWDIFAVAKTGYPSGKSQLHILRKGL